MATGSVQDEMKFDLKIFSHSVYINFSIPCEEETWYIWTYFFKNPSHFKSLKQRFKEHGIFISISGGEVIVSSVNLGLNRLKTFTEQILEAYRDENKIEAVSANIVNRADKEAVCSLYQQFYEKALLFPGQRDQPFIWVVAEDVVAKKISQSIEKKENKKINSDHSRTQEEVPKDEEEVEKIRRKLSKEQWNFAQILAKWPYFKQKLSGLNFTFQSEYLIMTTHNGDQNIEKLLDDFLSQVEHIYSHCYDDHSTSPETTEMLKMDCVKEFVDLALQENHFDNCLMELVQHSDRRTHPRIFHLPQDDPTQITETIKKCFFEFPSDHFMCRFMAGSKGLQRYGDELERESKGKVRILRLEDESYFILGTSDEREAIHNALSKKINELKSTKAVPLKNQIVSYVKRFKGNAVVNLEKVHKVRIELRRKDRHFEFNIEGPSGYVDNCHRALSEIVQDIKHKRFDVAQLCYQLPLASKEKVSDKHLCLIQDFELKSFPDDVTQGAQWSLLDGALSVSLLMDRNEEYKDGIVVKPVLEQVTRILEEPSSPMEKHICLPCSEVGDEVESRIKKQVDTIFQTLSEHTAHSVSFILSSSLYCWKTAFTVFKRGLHNFCSQEVISSTACQFYHSDKTMLEEMMEVADEFLEKQKLAEKSMQVKMTNPTNGHPTEQKKRKNAMKENNVGAIVHIISDTEEKCDKAWQDVQSHLKTVEMKSKAPAQQVCMPLEQNIDERARLGKGIENKDASDPKTSLHQSRLVITPEEECCCIIYITEKERISSPEDVKSFIRKQTGSPEGFRVLVYPFLHKEQGLMKFLSSEDCKRFLQRKFSSLQPKPFPPQAVNNVQAILSDSVKEKLKVLHVNKERIFENSGAVLCKERDWILYGNLLEIKAAHIYLVEVIKNGKAYEPTQNTNEKVKEEGKIQQPLENGSKRDFQMTNLSKERRYCSKHERRLMEHFVKDFKENTSSSLIVKTLGDDLCTYIGNSNTIKIFDDAKSQIDHMKEEHIDLTNQELERWRTCSKDFQRFPDVLLLNSSKGLNIYGMPEKMRQAKEHICKAIHKSMSSIEGTIETITHDIPSKFYKYLEECYPEVVTFCTVLELNDQNTKLHFTKSQEPEFLAAIKAVSRFNIVETIYMQKDEEIQKVCEAVQELGKMKDVVVDLDIDKNRVKIIGAQKQTVQNVKEILVTAKSKVLEIERRHDQTVRNNFNRQRSLQIPSQIDMVHHSHQIKTYAYCANILELNVDCIVNPIGENLSVKKGLSGIIFKAAGKDIEVSVLKNKQGKLSTGDMFPTGGGQLPYTHILHTVCPVWKDLEQEGGEDVVEFCSDKLRKCLEKCLQYSSSKHTSIALPVMGAGKIGGIPKILCASMYAQIVKEFCNEKRKSLSSIHIVDTSSENIQIVTEAFCKPGLLLWSYTFPNGKIKCMFPKGLTLSIYNGEFWKTSTKAVAVSVDSHFKNETWSSRKISDIGDEEYKKARKQLESRDSVPNSTGKVKFLGKINDHLPAKHVAHVVMHTGHYSECIKNLLIETNALECESLTFPFFGAGSGDQTKWFKFAEIIFTTIKNFTEGSKKRLKLKEIHLVNKDDKITAVLKDTFKECISKTYDKRSMKKYCNYPVAERSVTAHGENLLVQVK